MFASIFIFERKKLFWFRLREAGTEEAGASDSTLDPEREPAVGNLNFEEPLIETPASDVSCVKHDGEVRKVDVSLPNGDEVAENVVEALKSDVGVIEDTSNNLTCESSFTCSFERNLPNGGCDFLYGLRSTYMCIYPIWQIYIGTAAFVTLYAVLKLSCEFLKVESRGATSRSPCKVLNLMFRQTCATRQN